MAVMATAVGHSYASCTASSPYVCTGGGITIPATNQNGDLESSAQTISGLAGSISKITVAVNNWNDPAGTAPNLAPGHQDREFMLVFQPTSGPAQSFEFLAGLGSDNNSISNLSITLDDSASGYAPDHNEDVTGHPANGVSYKPTVNNPNVYCAVQNSNAALAGALVTLPACAPDNPSGPDESSGGTATFASQFSGSPNGTWTLYVWTNKQGVDSPATIDSWTLTITTQPNPANTTTTLASDAANNETTIGTTVTLTATVSSTSMVNEGAFTFTDNGTNLNCASGNPAVIAGNVAPCTTSFASEGSHALLAVYSEGPDFATSQGPMNLFVDNPTIATPGQPGQYCNPGVITLNSTSQTGASPYPQHITIPTQTGSLTDVSLLLHNINLPNGALHDLNVLLVDPHGNKFIPLAGTGGFNAISGLDLTLSDYGSGPLPDPLSGGSAITSGSYLPTDNNAGLSFPTGTPSGSYSQPQNQGGATFDTTFGGIDASGQWSLYVYDTLGNDIGTIAGYCLNITTTSAPATSTNLTASPSGSALVGQNVTFTATVTVNASGAPVNGGTVTLKEHGAILSGPSPVSSTGQVTFATSSLSEGIHTITALYSGVAGSYNVSSGSISIEVDTATSQTGNQYCNAGGINILATSSGQNTPANPYPSRINVTSLAGTVNSLTISLNNFSNSDPSGIAMLLQGPSATNIVFWNYAGGDNGIGPLNLTLADGSALIAAPPVDAASYAPTSNTLEPTPVFASPAPVNLSFAAPQASQTFTAAFQNINPNGYWDLYVYDRLGSQNLSIGQWCLTFNENAPILAITMSHSGSFTQGDTADIYTIQVTNDGPGSSAGTLSLVDTLPAGMTASAMSQTGGGTGSDWTCAAGTASCTRTTAMPAGETDIISLTVIVGSSTATGVNAVTNSVTVSGGGISQAQTANALTTINPSTVTVTVSTNVSGPMIQVDGGAAYTGSHQFTWSVNQAHSLTTSSPQGTGATVYTFTGWSDGTAATTDSITPPATVASYTAMFSTTYTTTVSASTSPITYSSSAQNVILSATVSSPSTLNTGTVTFTVMSNGTPIGPPVTSAPVTNGATSATFTVPANTAAGSYTIQAQYSGASSALVTYSSSSDTSHVLTVNAASQTITFATPAAVTYASGLTVNLAGDATASSGLPVAYTLQSGGTGLGSVTGTTLTVTQAGTFVIQASQAGNANYSAATPAQATLVVNRGIQLITFSNPG
ncbi:MAG: Ig-like domain repeat protein, partial [Acidobacteriaceae bacterium]|nr:Ig-like domain repeat protein [Acidobacteriaceae bacterium]